MKNLSSPRSLTNDPAHRTCSIVAILTTTVWTERTELHRLREKISGLEVRADLAGDPDPAVLRGLFDGELIYSLRSAEYGGAFVGSAEERRRCLLAAARSYDVIELEVDHDLTPELLAEIPPHRRRITWYGRGLDPPGLHAMFRRMARTPARLYLLAPEAETVQQAMAPLRLLAELGREDVTAFATGNLGICGRVLAPWFGASVVFGALGRVGGCGVPHVVQLLNDYPFPLLPPIEQVYGIVSRPMRDSHSPHLHNAAYRALDLPALYLPMPANEFAKSWRAMCAGLDAVGLTFGGATVTAPFKEDALRLADSASAESRRSGAANLLARGGGGWRAYTTDPAGVVGALRRAGVRLTGQRAAVVGCGGAGRGAAAGLVSAGAVPTMFNRGRARGRYAADLLGVDYLPLSAFRPEDYSLIVHATPVRDDPPFSVYRVTDDTAVVDLAYGPEPTRLAAEVDKRGGVVVDGWRVLEVEADTQFRLLTGRAMPALSTPVTRAGIPVIPPQRRSVR